MKAHPDEARLALPRIGCAGWSIAAAHRGLLGAGDNALTRYATFFDAVEINSSFYRSHRRQTYERWCESVPADFRFCVKMPQTVTHDARLHGVGSLLDGFLDEIAGLGAKLGGVLVQLPPSLPFEARTANTFFTMLRRRYDGETAFEPRHSTWFAAPPEALLQQHRIARVAADPSRAQADAMPGGASNAWRYWRLHGSPRIYYSGYDDERLRAYAAQIAAHRDIRNSWCIFDNTAAGHAAGDAARLRGLFATDAALSAAGVQAGA